MDPLDFKTVSYQLSRYLHDDDDFFCTRHGGMTVEARIRKVRLISEFLERFNKAFPSPENRLSTIDEDDTSPVSAGFSTSDSLVEATQSTVSDPTLDVSEDNIQSLIISYTSLLGEESPVTSGQPIILHGRVKGKSVASLNSGISDISFLSGQQVTSPRQRNLGQRSVRTELSPDSGINASTTLSHGSRVGLSPLLSPSLQDVQLFDSDELLLCGSPSWRVTETLNNYDLAALATITSNPQHLGPRRLLTPARRRAIVQIVSREIRGWMGKSFYEALQDIGETEHRNHNSAPPAALASSSHQQARRGSKRKAAEDNNNQSDDDSDTPDQPKRRKNQLQRGSKAQVEKFACPCFKKEPARYTRDSKCTTVPYRIKRLKEHLKRKHLPQFECERCFQSFYEKMPLNAHLNICSTLVEPPTDRPVRLAREMYRKITNKALFEKKKPDVEKWRTIYQILYPDDVPADYPSPFHEVYTVEEFSDYISQNLPRVFGPKLENETEERKSRLVQLIKESLLEVKDEFQISAREAQRTGIETQDIPRGETGDHIALGNPGPRIVYDGNETHPPPVFLDEKMAQTMAEDCIKWQPWGWDCEQDVAFCLEAPEDRPGSRFSAVQLDFYDTHKLPFGHVDSGYESLHRDILTGCGNSFGMREDVWVGIEACNDLVNAESQKGPGAPPSNPPGNFIVPESPWDPFMDTIEVWKDQHTIPTEGIL